MSRRLHGKSMRQGIIDDPTALEVAGGIGSDPDDGLDLAAFEARIARQVAAVEHLTAAMRNAEAATAELREVRRADRHRRLFGHPQARVLILPHRLEVLHPRGAA